MKPKWATKNNFHIFLKKKGQQSRFWRRKVRERKECSITHAACNELPTMRKQTWLKYKKLWGEQIVHLPEKCWSKHIKLHHCVGGLDETSWTITWGTSQKANTSINISFNKCRQSCKAVGPMVNIWCLSNGKLNLAKANFQKSKSVLRSFNFVIGKRESRALSILG